MSFLMAIFLGIVQGITEFLPISSSGHLAIFQNFGLEDPHDRHLFFDTLLHLGTLIAVFIVYRKDIADMWRATLSLVRGRGQREVHGTDERRVPQSKARLALMIIIATLPLVFILPLRRQVEFLGSQTWFVGLMLLVTGGILFLSDKLVKGYRDEKNMTAKNAIVIGFFQLFAIMPGISRSGTTITGGMLTGLDRAFAVRFSFLMSIPAILGANIIVFFTSMSDVDWSLMPQYLVGFVVATVVGYFAIGLVKRIVDAGKFGKFAYYCWGLGALAILVWLGSLIFGG